MTGSNPFTLTGLWAAVLLHYEALCERVEAIKSFVHKLIFWMQLKTVFNEHAELKPMANYIYINIYYLLFPKCMYFHMYTPN